MVKTIVLTQHEGGRLSATYGDKEVIIDWKEEEGGTSQWMSPGELFCASIGACTVMNVVRYSERIGITKTDCRLTRIEDMAQNYSITE